jgi:ATP-dependent Zn protease
MGIVTHLRNILLWIVLMFLALVIWHRISPSSDTERAPAPALSYSDFMKQVDAKNIGTANFTFSANTAELTGNLKQPAESYTTSLPRDAASGLMDILRQQGTTVQVAQSGNWKTVAIRVVPLIVLLIVWTFTMMNRARARQNPSPPNQPTPGALG